MIDEALSLYLGIRVYTKTWRDGEWWHFRAHCYECRQDLADLEFRDSFFEDAIHARKLATYRVLEEIEKNKCECGSEPCKGEG